MEPKLIHLIPGFVLILSLIFKEQSIAESFIIPKRISIISLFLSAISYNTSSDVLPLKSLVIVIFFFNCGMVALDK